MNANKGISEFLDSVSRVTMRLSVITANLIKIAATIVAFYLILRLAAGIFDFGAALFKTLPQWPR
ncbi:MAG: hypothetical protein PHU49_00495 [Syntrophorhabdaceae bacterium]|jgi:hypothetical protein|nr:hypothetical protein [Syntrophorhabdaceae bacterium]